jgi:putative redox protein
MGAINVKWTGAQQYLAADEAGHTIVTDSHGQGFKPAELVMVALVGCAGVDFAGILEKKKQKVTGIEVRATKQDASEPPWPITRIEMEWTVRGRGLKEKAVQDALRLAEDKYCSVAASLKSEIVTVLHVLNDED